MKNKLVTTLVSAVLLTACASNSKHVSRDAAYKTVNYGLVLSKEEITLEGSNSGIGAYVGSVAAVHDATSNSFVGFLVRGFAGAILGSAVEKAVTSKDGALYTIETANGSLIEIATANKELAKGECVKISNAGHRRSDIEIVDTQKCHDLSIALPVVKNT